MGSFLVLKILDSQSVSLPSTLIYGSVELRSYRADSECEIAILKESASINRADFNKYSYCARIATIVEADNISEAIDISDNSFSAILDLKSVEFAISSFKTSSIGFVKDLESGEIHPISKQVYEPSMSFIVHQGDVQRLDMTNYILSLDNDLSARYQRSLHWARNSKHETNSQLKVLFHWFAVEALLKESETDNVGGMVRWFLGFPNGKQRQDVSPQVLTKLSNHPKYGFWSSNLTTTVDDIRIFRNDSVHAGFRSVDFTKYDLELYSQIMIFSTSRCQAAVQSALMNGISSVSEFKEYIGLIFESNQNLINDVHNNIIFSFEQLKIK